MRKTKIITWLLLIVLLLSACGKGKDRPHMETAAETKTTDTKTWTGQGGSYAAHLLPLADYAGGYQDVYALLPQGEHVYCLAWNYDDAGYHLLADGTEIGTISGGIHSMHASPEGLWLLTDEGESGMRLQLISLEGEPLRDILFPQLSSVSVEQMRCMEDRLCFINSGQLLVMDGEGQQLSTAALPAAEIKLRLSAGGQIYAVAGSPEGSSFYSLDRDSGQLTAAFQAPAGTVYDGGGEDPFLLKTRDGLYRLTEDGSTQPIVIWEECGISMGELYGVFSLGLGRYVCRTMSGYFELVPVAPEDIQEKIQLRLVTVFPGGFSGLSKAVTAFNAQSEIYQVHLEDYSQGMALDQEQAQLRLNTEIISGKGPDMICFEGLLSPYPYIGKGLLVDLKPLMEQDGEVHPEDILLSKALEHKGGIYLMADSFALPTLEARAADFGDRFGWTLEEYRQIDSQLKDGQMCIYNLTRENYLNKVASRYIRHAVDWDTGTCDFDNAEFKQVLQTALELRETPEDPNNMVFGPGEPQVAAGTQVTNAVFTTRVFDLAQSERAAGCPLSFIGWPTADGSCGTDAYLTRAVGICSQSQYREGCWAFIKFMLTQVNTDEQGLYVYRPAMEESIRKAMADENCPVKMNSDDVEKLMALIGAVENFQGYDQAIMSIIKEACAAMFNGDKTVDETAQLIQSRASIYVAEQK